MQHNDLFNELERVLSPDASAQVFSALRQDPLVWQSLERGDFSQLALGWLGSRAERWSPGQLALLAVGESLPADVLRAEPLLAPAQPLQDRALQAYQSIKQTGVPPASLREAGLLALALRERRRLTGSWNGLLQEITLKAGGPKTGASKPGQPQDASAQIAPGQNALAATLAAWRTPLACLYSLVPDPEEMLHSLLPRNFQLIPLELIVHIQLSQPLSDGQHTAAIARVMQGLPVPLQLGLLRSFNLRGRERLAAALAGQLVVGHPAFACLRSPGSPNDSTLAGLSSRALALQQMGAFYQLAGERDQALSLYDASENTLKQLLAGLYLQRLDLQVAEKAAAGKGLGGPSVLMESDQMAVLAAEAGWLDNALGVVLMSHPYAGSLLEQVPGEADGAFLQLKRARQMFQTEPAVARDMARQSAAGLLEVIHRQGLPFWGEFVYNWRPEDALSILLEMGLPEDAARLAQALLSIRPADISLLHLACRIDERLGSLDQAIQCARSLTALDPSAALGHRLLGSLWGKSGRWDLSLTQWQVVLALSDKPPLSDRLACAQAAFQAGHPDQAVAICETVLQAEANNGPALGILGQALVAKGEAGRAAGYLVRATLLSPEILPPWLALARLQTEQGETRRALETLRAAVTAIPDAAEGHLALGEACLDGGLLTEALPHLKKAFTLSDESPRSALLVSRALRLLGHSNEARAALEKVRPAWTAFPELAFEYAQVLLDLNDAENALPVLELALSSGLPVLDASLLYARILLGEFQAADGQEGLAGWEAVPGTPARPTQTRLARLEHARQAMEHILEIAPENLEARFLMADILREKGELEKALAVYCALAELPAAEVPELCWRVQWGLGRTALLLGQTDTALAALKDACQARPDHLPVHRSLAEVSLRANLLQQALEAAANVLRLAPDDMDTLSWFAEFVTRAGEPRLAVEALERAVQLEPERADLLVSLAGGRASAGNLAGARTSLEAVMALAVGGQGRVGEQPAVSREDLRRAAHVYLRLEDPRSALTCYTFALKAGMDAPTELLFEVAQLHERMGNDEAALDLIQQAFDDNQPGEPEPLYLPMHLLQADLLARLNRPQAAQAVLERALRVAQSSPAPSDAGGGAEPPLLGEIHDRFTRLMIQSGDLSAALHHAEKSLEYSTASAARGVLAARCCRAADLARNLLQPDRAARIVQSFQPGEGAFPRVLFDLGRDGLDLLSLKVELVLEQEPESASEAAGWIDEALREAPGDGRLLAAKARLLARNGDLAAARLQFTALRQAGTVSAPRNAIGLAEAALDVEEWNEACALFEAYARSYPGEARAQMGLARALVLRAERQRLCEAAGCRRNAPGLSALSEESRRKFEEAVQAAGNQAGAGSLVNADEISRWQARGRAAFNPTAQAARALTALPTHSDDIAALVATLRQLKNRAAAVQVARRCAENPLVLLQLALCYQDDPSPEGLAVARQAVHADPHQPLAHAVLAMLSRKAGEISGAGSAREETLAAALEAYENALQTWPEETAWHEAAGDLCMQMGSLPAGIDHYQQALALETDNPRFAYKLGSANLQLRSANLRLRSASFEPGQASSPAEDLSGAIACLEMSAALGPHQADVWLTLATAYQMAGRLPQALEAARKAAELNPSAAEALLVAGEAALSLNLTDQALEFAQGAVRREPENAGAVLFLSGVLVLRGQVENGLEVIEQASPAVRTFFPAAIERARLIRRLHGPQAAVDVLEKLAKDNPDEPELLGFLARTQAECGDLKSAERYAFRALRLDPNQPDLTLMLGRLNRANGHLDQAVHLLCEVIRMAPDTLEAYLELGSVYQERREHGLALQTYRQALRIAPGDYQAYYQCGLILRDSKDYSGAENMLRRAVELAPDNAGQVALSIRRQLVAVIALNLVHSEPKAPPESRTPPDPKVPPEPKVSHQQEVTN